MPEKSAALLYKTKLANIHIKDKKIGFFPFEVV